MHALVLLVGAALPAGLPNLDFATGCLDHWEGGGFSLGPAGSSGPSVRFAACSSDRGRRGRTALLHRTFVVPAGTAFLRCEAAAIRPPRVKPAGALDVILEAAAREVVPRQVLTAEGWRSAPVLLPAHKGRPAEYAWDVRKYVGRRVRIAVVDGDDRPGCYVRAGGFRLVPADPLNVSAFATHMRKLVRDKGLPGVYRLDSKHFVAMSNASEGFTEYRLENCETLYALFFDHFRKRGFAVRRPGEKLMVAIFNSQAGFEGYLGERMSTAVTGLYHPASNRLVVYDYAGNRAFLAGQERNREVIRQATNDLERERLIVAVGRHENDRRADANISTVMHEAAHQLSFNCGLLSRQGDVPLWLAEGLACYCEATVNGAWQGIGQPNPLRANILAGPTRGEGAFLPLRALVENDDWIRKAERTEQVLLGYSQSWALFGMLMRDRPKALRRYLETIEARRTPEHRLADFVECFGSLLALEKRYQAHLRDVARQQARELGR